MRHSLGNKVGQRDGEARPPVTALSLSSSAGKILVGIKSRAKEMVHRMRRADLLFHLQQDKRQQTGTGISRERILCALMRSRATAIRHRTERKDERHNSLR